MTALQTIAEHLTRHRQTVTCAESCTGGLLAGAFTSIAGSSQWFHQSFVTYSNQAKEERLGVMPDTLLKHGAVSRETVYEMARGAKAVAQADYALSISGIAGPGGGSVAKPVGTVWFGLSTPTESLEQMKIFSATERPSEIRPSPSPLNFWRNIWFDGSQRKNGKPRSCKSENQDSGFRRPLPQSSLADTPLRNCYNHGHLKPCCQSASRFQTTFLPNSLTEPP